MKGKNAIKIISVDCFSYLVSVKFEKNKVKECNEQNTYGANIFFRSSYSSFPVTQYGRCLPYEKPMPLLLPWDQCMKHRSANRTPHGRSFAL